MCSGLLHDEQRNLPHREIILEAIQKGLKMLGELSSESKTTAALYRILKGLLVKLPLSGREQGVIGAPKRTKWEQTAVPNRAPVVRSPSNPPAAEANTGRRHSIASSASVGTLDSSNFHPNSASSVSVADSGQSLNVQAGSDYRSPGSSAVPSGGVAGVDAAPSSGAFIPSNSPVPLYPATSNAFIPTTSAMPPSVFVPAEGFVPTTGYHHYGNLPVGHPDALPYSHPGGWQAPQVAVSEPSQINVLQGGNLAGFDSTTPTVLEYWDWQGLDLGHPVSWGASAVQASGQGCDGRVMVSDGLGSSVAESSPRSQ